MTVQTVKVAEAKSRFSELLAAASRGETVNIIKGQQPEPIATLTAYKPEKRKKIIFDELKKFGELEISDDWEITTEEFLGL